MLAVMSQVLVFYRLIIDLIWMISAITIPLFLESIPSSRFAKSHHVQNHQQKSHN